MRDICASALHGNFSINNVQSCESSQCMLTGTVLRICPHILGYVGRA